MLNLLFEDMPECLEIDEVTYSIDTDYRSWIAINEALLDPSLKAYELLYLIEALMEDVPEDKNALIDKASYFLRGNVDEHKRPGIRRKSRYVFSFTHDCNYLIGAFQECYGIDLIHIEHLHWWHFNALLESLNSSCELKQRIYYRSLDVSKIKNKEERRRIRQIQRDIALPAQEISESDIAEVFA